MAEHGGNGLKARPTVHKGIQMRSRLEAGFAMWLDQHNLVWEYEPQCFAGREGQYLPDFRIDVTIFGPHDDLFTEPRYVEVKPTVPPPRDVRRWISVLADNDISSMLIVIESQPDVCRWVGCLNGDEPPDWPFGYTALHWVHHLDTVALACDADHPWAGEWWKGANA